MPSDPWNERSGKDSEYADTHLMRLHQAFQRSYRNWKVTIETLREMRRDAGEAVGLSTAGGSSLLKSTILKNRRAAISQIFEREANEEALLEKWGYGEMQERANTLQDYVGRTANEIFSTPAQTLSGLAIKVDVLQLALGRRGTQEDGDEDLEAFQSTASQPWFDSIARDIRRMNSTTMTDGIRNVTA
ncbi:hypothetical protein [Ferruginivarius sediminum]|uniref:hypothetical protein n=1 Tax=Ferruginivarius sediminum TaxID=2661937 RepID=UPI0011C051E6|nr:hypothetical protein [Ferruginivarius sediminum]